MTGPNKHSTHYITHLLQSTELHHKLWQCVIKGCIYCVSWNDTTCRFNVSTEVCGERCSSRTMNHKTADTHSFSNAALLYWSTRAFVIIERFPERWDSRTGSVQYTARQCVAVVQLQYLIKTQHETALHQSSFNIHCVQKKHPLLFSCHLSF